ncbi:MAG: hypothetical protein Q7S40_34170 [Opitutaceae bacterium]|nr:hypothetical protein [Opitutaceae bacterium]
MSTTTVAELFSALNSFVPWRKSEPTIPGNSISSVRPSTTMLLGYAHLAKAHWQEHCPRMVRELEATGRLESALVDAEAQTLTEMETLQRELKRSGSTSAQAHQQAWELVREKYLLLPPESP